MFHDFKLFNTLKMKTRDHFKHIEIQYFASLFMIFIQLNLLVVLLSKFCWSEWGISQTELGFNSSYLEFKDTSGLSEPVKCRASGMPFCAESNPFRSSSSLHEVLTSDFEVCFHTIKQYKKVKQTFL